MVFTGHANGLNPTTCFSTQMSQPLGYAIGNWLEVQECLEIMQGQKQPLTEFEQSYDLIALVCIQAGQMLLQSGLEEFEQKSLNDLTQLAYEALQSGKALKQFIEMALAQGADPKGVDSLWYPNKEQQFYKGISVLKY
jgi:pyrimidine-nucleoside phosphorylase